MRDRLIELLKQADAVCDSRKQCEGCVGFGKGADCVNYHITDYLLANGVIVPPCKVGQTVYVPWRWADEQGIATVKVEEMNFYTKHNVYMFFIDLESDDEYFNQAFGGWKIGDSIGKTVFLSREEAERALKGGVEE